jgi:hypothetical protein
MRTIKSERNLWRDEAHARPAATRDEDLLARGGPLEIEAEELAELVRADRGWPVETS